MRNTRHGAAGNATLANLCARPPAAV
jgi:hypothetical protein